jgi:GGDEF domain-containing protein
VTASFGVASFPDDAKDATGLLELADRAMYGAKQAGKGRVHGV